MYINSLLDPYKQHRPAFLANSLVLALIMVLYQAFGLLLVLLLPEGLSRDMLLQPETVRTMVAPLRVMQALGQVLLLALPVLLLAFWHVRRSKLFVQESLAFLGLHSKVNIRLFLLSLAGIVLLQPLVTTLAALQNRYLWPSLGAFGANVMQQRDQMEAFIAILSAVRDVPEFFAVLLVFAVIPACCEELLFRGYIQQNYTRSLPAAGAVALTSVLFALFHLSVANVVPLTLLGWYIGYFYSKTGSLLYSIAIHLLNNSAAVVLLLLVSTTIGQAASNTDSLLLEWWWWVVVAVSAILFALLLRQISGLSKMLLCA